MDQGSQGSQFWQVRSHGVQHSRFQMLDGSAQHEVRPHLYFKNNFVRAILEGMLLWHQILEHGSAAVALVGFYN